MQAAALRAAPIGTGHLHHALEDARQLDRLHRFCRAVGLDAGAVSTTDGKRLDTRRVFDAMCALGYAIGEPAKAPVQARRSFTTWLVDIALPQGPALQIAFFTAQAGK